jgi:hypothetical protein
MAMVLMAGRVSMRSQPATQATQQARDVRERAPCTSSPSIADDDNMVAVARNGAECMRKARACRHGHSAYWGRDPKA